jgi:glycosyltransferase involved in cell wall biosynthesis
MWYDIKLPAILKKHKADLFISFDGLCSMTTGIPQIIVFNDSFLWSRPSTGSGLPSSTTMRIMKKSLRKAETIICYSESRKQHLVHRYLVDANKLDVMCPAVKETFQPLNESVKEEVRMNFCDGKNYFAYAGTVEQHRDLFNLLKGFSAFKKLQKSNWKLLLMGNAQQYDRKFMDSLATFKYRGDVVVAKDINERERARLIGSAYAFICPARSELMVFPILQALKCGVPVITTDAAVLKEFSGDDALHYNPGDPQSIAAQMMNLYKDEAFRSTLVEKAKAKTPKYNFEQAAGILEKHFRD